MTTITLGPDRRLNLAEGAPLRDVLFGEGVEFPCGGRGRCKGCRVRVTAGVMAPCADDRAAFSPRELQEGWRLSCRHTADADVTLELAQWDMAILGDEEEFAFTPRHGLGVAVDLGTTTIAAQLLDLSSGKVLGATTALNAQARHGADVLSRAAYALAGGDLTEMIRAQIGAMVAALAADRELSRIVIVGNSVMHHLFGGLDITPLATHPFLPRHPGTLHFTGTGLGWQTDAAVEVLPCIGGLVGGDVLAGVSATGLAHHRGFGALVDLGTNGEVVVARDGEMLCTSTAAGPAFEGARIHAGMRAATGAIDAIEIVNGAIACRVIGGGTARGLCGSGLVDAVAAGLDLGMIAASGRLQHAWALQDGIALTPHDVRELQLAKGAIAAGLKLLTAKFGATPADLDTLHLAGAFGNAINRVSAVRTGLLRLAVDRIVPAGNTALKGAKRALFSDIGELESLARSIGFVPLSEEPLFEDTFADEMSF